MPRRANDPAGTVPGTEAWWFVILEAPEVISPQMDADFRR
jgi:hypothetical protein